MHGNSGLNTASLLQQTTAGAPLLFPCVVDELSFGDADQARTILKTHGGNRGHFDVILGSDISYQGATVPLLVDTLVHMVPAGAMENGDATSVFLVRPHCAATPLHGLRKPICSCGVGGIVQSAVLCKWWWCCMGACVNQTKPPPPPQVRASRCARYYARASEFVVVLAFQHASVLPDPHSNAPFRQMTTPAKSNTPSIANTPTCITHTHAAPQGTRPAWITVPADRLTGWCWV